MIGGGQIPLFRILEGKPSRGNTVDTEIVLDLLIPFSYPLNKVSKVQKFISQKILSFIRPEIAPDRFPYLTILSNVFLGFAFGRIVVMPAEELIESVSIKVLLIIGTCLFFNYVLCVRKAAKGITCSPSGKIRPFLREVLLCAATNAFIFLLSLSLFFFKSRYLLG
jgi:hypothetical protein